MTERVAGSEALSLPQQAADVAARIERLPQTRTQINLRVIVGSALFFDAFDAWSMSVAAPVLLPLWKLSHADVGLLLGIAGFGQLVGTLLFGWIAERLGRKPTVSICIAIFGVCSFLCALAPNYQTLLIVRLIQGLGLGGALPVGATYISEFAPRKGRGFFVLIYQNAFAFGMLFVALLGRFIVPTVGWQGIFFVGAVPAFIVFILRFLVPESPRWLAAHGRYDEASKIVTKLEEEVARAGKPLPPPEIKPAAPRQETRIAELFSSFYRRRTLVLWSIQFVVVFSMFAITSWLPTLYTTVFKVPIGRALTYSLITVCCNFIAGWFPTLFVDRVGRKFILKFAMLLGAIFVGILWMTGARDVSTMVVLSSLAVMCFANIAILNNLYATENFPTRMRAMGSGTTAAVGRIAAICGPYVTGFLVPAFGLSSVFLLVAGLLFAGALVVFTLAIETKGVSLEELAP
jgi:putative MFS transporter